jgi:enediyne biosynthesis protein E4
MAGATKQQKEPPGGTARQVSLVLLFFALVGSVPLCRDYLSGPGAVDPEQADAAGALARYGFHLQEVSKQCGIDFKHQAPVLDARLAHIMPIVASMGAAVAVADFDRDGLPDLYVVNSAEGSRNCLYRNMGDGTFEDVAEKMGVADLNRPGSGACMGAVWGDYDNDGYEDLLVYRWGRPELFHNDRGKGFTRVTDTAGLPARVNANSAIWLDFDRDGLLDLFIAGYWADDIDLWHVKTTQIMPESFQYANNGGRKYLLRNKGDGTFEDVTEKVGITSRKWTLAVAATDLRGTGYPDLVLANDYGVNEFYANDGGKHFREIGSETRVGDQSKSGMSVSFGDVYNQGRFALYVSNITEPGILQQWNNLWVPERDRAGDDLRYTNQAGTLGVERGGWSWGAQFGDLNNDGTQDLYLVNGYISAGERSSYWYDFAQIAVGHSAIIGDAQNWPAMKGRSLSGYQRKRVWLNDGAGRFTDVAQIVGATDVFDGRAVALADLSNTGALDVLVANQRGPFLIYRNTVQPGRHWIDVDLEGSASNRSAIGARVEVRWDGRTQVQEVSGGSGFSAQNQRRLHYGLGAATGIERVDIRWPSGRRQTLERPAVDQIHRVKEPR